MENSDQKSRAVGSSRRKRSIWFHLHFWIGWVAAVPIVLVCLTGALLVFEGEIFRWEHPELFRLDVKGEPMSVQEVLETYRSADPPLRVNHLGVPTDPRHAYSAYCTELRPEGNRGARVFLDPYTGELMRLSGEVSISETIVALHRRLASGKVGQQIVGVSSLALAVTGVVGLVLWWPLRGGTFRRAWRRGQALDWHNALGLVSLLPLIVMAITGVTFTWGKQLWPALEKLQGGPSQVAPPPVEIAGDGEKVSLDTVVSRVRVQYPGKRITGIQPGGGQRSPIKLFLDADGSSLQIVAHPYTGKILQRIDGSGTETGPAGWYRRNFGKWHTLHPYGLVARVVWGLLSLGGAVLVVTGLWISIKRRRRKRGHVSIVN